MGQEERKEMICRMYRVKPDDTPESLARAGKGDKRELYEANRAWLSSTFHPWNPGQQMVIPATWEPIPDEYPSESK
jgi:hypothetical protein